MMDTRFLNRIALTALLAVGIAACGGKEKADESKKDDPKKEAPAEKAQGRQYSSQMEKFSVAFPGELGPPQRSEQPIATEAGNINMVQVVSSSADGNTAAMVMYGAYPESAFEAKTTAKMLDDIRDGAMKSGEAKLDKQEDYDFNGMPARRCFFNVNMGGQQGYARFDFILAKPALYQVAYISTSKANVDRSETEDYFKSFSIMK
ncbi:MAG: hypothetical protein IT211_09450 [Armatimonadetes bacterium]|nr:hypothetical protein [Armatimonadota bacterium]